VSKKTFFIQAGDLLLVRGTNPMSKPIVLGQKLIKPLHATSSHILISIADGIYIHATGDKGVHITTFKEELPTVKDDWKAIRLKDITDEQLENLIKSVLHYMGQDYNSKFFISSETSSFCSELASKIYKKANISILGDKEAQNVIPADFDKEANIQGEWEDVTIETKECFDKLDSKEIDMAYCLYKRSMNLVTQRRQTDKKLDDIFLNTDIVSEDFKEEYRNIKQNVADKLVMPYWDENFKKEKDS
jgi:hypothetical protein